MRQKFVPAFLTTCGLSKRAAAITLGLSLAACATPKPPPGVDVPKPQRPTPSLCTKVEKTPSLPDGSGLVQPITEAEKQAFTIFMTYVADLFDTARANQSRAEQSRKALCG